MDNEVPEGALYCKLFGENGKFWQKGNNFYFQPDMKRTIKISNKRVHYVLNCDFNVCVTDDILEDGGPIIGIDWSCLEGEDERSN